MPSRKCYVLWLLSYIHVFIVIPFESILFFLYLFQIPLIPTKSFLSPFLIGPIDIPFLPRRAFNNVRRLVIEPVIHYKLVMRKAEVSIIDGLVVRDNRVELLTARSTLEAILVGNVLVVNQNPFLRNYNSRTAYSTNLKL